MKGEYPLGEGDVSRGNIGSPVKTGDSHKNGGCPFGFTCVGASCFDTCPDENRTKYW